MSFEYTHLLWDFNGTLFDDVDAGIESANDLLVAHGLPRFSSRETYRETFGFPIADYYRRMGFDFSRTPYADLAVEWVAYYLERSRASGLFDDVIKTLTCVKKAGVSNWILSATELTMLTKQVESLGVRQCFDGLLGLDNIHAYSKSEIGVRWRGEDPDARVLLIGDTDHDAEVAAAMGVDCALVARGHQGREKLETCRAIAVTDTLTELLDLLLGI